jgi:hypothetical protein
MDTAIEALRKCALEWADVDEYYVSKFEDEVQRLEADRDEFKAEVAQRLADGEEIGL